MRRLVGSLCAFALLVAPGTALAAVSGTVTRLSDGSPIEGAAVTVAGSGQQPVTGDTAANGTFSIDIGGSGPYGVGVEAPGFASQSESNVPQGGQVSFALTPATFTPLPVDVASTESVAADARTGIFYALAGGAPDVYRTLDYGGAWTPVTLSYDDPQDGLRNTNQRNVLAASSVSGEIAVATATGAVSFSRDYGLTWRTVGGNFAPGGFQATRNPLLFWGHASPGATDDVLLFAQAGSDGMWHVWRADMSAVAPEFVTEASDPFGSGAEIAEADSATGSFLGRLSSSGALSFAPLTARAPIVFGPDEATGLPTPPRLLRLGGAKEASAPPDGALVAGGDAPFVAQMLTKSAGATSFAGASSSAPTTLSNCTFGRDGFGGSVAPTTTGTAGAGSLTGCWVQKHGSDPLSFGGAEGHDVVYDADFGQGNFVLFNRGHGQGPEKASRLDADGVPVVEFDQASAGTGPESGGFSVRGMISASVNDTEYGPGGSGELAVASQIALASKDGGRTMTELIVPRAAGGQGPAAVQWWRGASADWLVFGHAPAQNCGNKLSAFVNWNGTSTIGGPNVSGSGCADLGGQSSVFSLAAVPGTDTLFIGVGTFDGTGSRLYRARLAPGDPPSLTDVLSVADPLPNKPAAMEYCPSSSARPDMRDVLFVAAGEPYPHAQFLSGALLRITDATSGSPVVTVVDSVPHGVPDAPLADVRADCEGGVVYAGGKSNDVADPNGLYKSVDGGQTFERIRVPGPTPPFSLGELTAIGLNPADPTDVKVAGEPSGTIAHSADGGATWTIVNDPATARPMRVQDIEFPPGATGGAARTRSSVRAAASEAPALVGTDGGAFHGDLAAATGVIGVTGATAGAVGLAARITTLGSDSHPVVVPAPGMAVRTTVFHRDNGLYETSASQGSWPLPSAIPGTAGSDDLPAAVTDSSGRLQLAFARTGAGAGIYVATRGADGAWSAPRRVSRKAGDTLPAIALAGNRIHVAFLRTRGSARGVYHASTRGAKWRTASRVRGTRAADAKVALGGPSLATRAGRPQLVFARARRAAGIYYAAGRKSGWRAPKRLTKVAGDSQPALAVAPDGLRQVVFRRTRGQRTRRGLFALRGRKAWSIRRVPGTVAADREPAVTLSGASLLLTFARPSGAAPGIYYDLASASGRWPPKPFRFSASATDRSPALQLGGAGRLTIVFDRG
jgi:hypothetical protein